jgi:hypothetical protein
MAASAPAANHRETMTTVAPSTTRKTIISASQMIVSIIDTSYLKPETEFDVFGL